MTLSYHTPNNAKIVGTLFLISDITSIIALALYQPLFKSNLFLSSTQLQTWQISLGAFLEIILAISVAGTAIWLYPILNKKTPEFALAYVIGRAIEGVIILIGAISLLSILTLQNTFLTQKISDQTTYQVIANSLIAIHDWTFLFGPNIVLSVNATILGWALLKSKIVPNWIAKIALVNGPMLFISGTAVLFGLYSQVSPIAAIVALPMLTFEVSFSIFLLRKKFFQI